MTAFSASRPKAGVESEHLTEAGGQAPPPPLVLDRRACPSKNHSQPCLSLAILVKLREILRQKWQPLWGYVFHRQLICIKLCQYMLTKTFALSSETVWSLLLAPGKAFTGSEPLPHDSCLSPGCSEELQGMRCWRHLRLLETCPEFTAFS